MNGTRTARAVPALRVVGVGIGVGAVARLLGFDLDHAIFLGLGALVVTLAVVVVRLGGTAVAWLPDGPHGRDGSRLEVASLSWALLGRDGRVSEQALRRLRTVAEGRLARHGLSMADVGDHEQIHALLGDTAWAVLTTRAFMPSRREFERCVRALELADPRPADPPRR